MYRHRFICFSIDAQEVFFSDVVVTTPLPTQQPKPANGGKLGSTTDDGHTSTSLVNQIWLTALGVKEALPAQIRLKNDFSLSKPSGHFVFFR